LFTSDGSVFLNNGTRIPFVHCAGKWPEFNIELNISTKYNFKIGTVCTKNSLIKLSPAHDVLAFNRSIAYSTSATVRGLSNTSKLQVVSLKSLSLQTYQTLCRFQKQGYFAATKTIHRNPINRQHDQDCFSFS